MSDNVLWYGRCLFVTGALLFGLLQIALAIGIHDEPFLLGAMVAYYASIIFFVVGLGIILADIYRSQGE
ncbi:hypothetical protein ABC345_03880 [Shouchella sp. 1P09AA]|uniref:hypothetical protein n=1 Tax=unclassified Shouchella TaxID=2893065 RepID=UPI0039A17448